MESLRVEQSFLGRIFNYGSILVSGAGNPQAPIFGISEPIRFKNRYFEVQEEA
ncbi:MAG: PH domain-containing protein [Candidatus Reddybacter sp.]